ncbi:hypothetical protein ACWD4K_37895, partial [Streptomyces gelaticus]
MLVVSVLASPFRGRHAPAGLADKTVMGLLNQADRKIEVREGRRQHPDRLRAGCRGELGQADTG